MKKDRSLASQTAPEASPTREANEVYDLFLAELEVRRQRLRQLLHMVTMEASRRAPDPAARPRRTRCRRVSISS